MSTATHANKLLVEQLYRDCINSGRVDLLDDLIHPEFVGAHGEKGPEGFTETIAHLRNGFPDVHFTLEDVIAERDRVVTRWRMEGTQRGPFAGFPASQKRVSHTAIAIYQIKDSQIVRLWLQPDHLGLLQQIGAIPPLAVQTAMGLESHAQSENSSARESV